MTYAMFKYENLNKEHINSLVQVTSVPIVLCYQYDSKWTVKLMLLHNNIFLYITTPSPMVLFCQFKSCTISDSKQIRLESYFLYSRLEKWEEGRQRRSHRQRGKPLKKWTLISTALSVTTNAPVKLKCKLVLLIILQKLISSLSNEPSKR